MAQAKTKAKAQPEEATASYFPGGQAAPPPPWLGGATITQSQFEELFLKKGQEEYELLLEALRDNGSLSIVPDP